MPLTLLSLYGTSLCEFAPYIASWKHVFMFLSMYVFIYSFIYSFIYLFTYQVYQQDNSVMEHQNLYNYQRHI